jgi:transcriptional regulator with XRE-family HTH domain
MLVCETPVTMFHLGDIVRKLRSDKTRNWTAKDLAKRAGVNKGTISNLEQGNLDPRLSTLESIAKAFDMDLWVLIRQASDPHSASGKDGADVTAAMVQRNSLDNLQSTLAAAAESMRLEVARLDAFVAEQTRKRG